MNLKNLSPRAVFWTRMVAWLSVGCAIPVSTFAIKFGLFSTAEPAVDSLGNAMPVTYTGLSGWGIVSILLVGSYLSNIVKEIAESRPGYSLTKQCYKGLAKLIPWIIVYAICFFLRSTLDQVMYCLLVLIICKAISIPINPMPKWKYEKLGEENYSDLLETFTGFVKSFKKGGVK